MKIAIIFLVVCIGYLQADDNIEKRGLSTCHNNRDCGPDACCMGIGFCSDYVQEDGLCTIRTAFMCGCAKGLTCVSTGFLIKRCKDLNPGSGGF